MRRKKRKKNTGIKERLDAPAPAAAPAGVRPLRRSGFIWGIALGVTIALGVSVAGDLGGVTPLAHPDASAQTAATIPPPDRSIYLTSPLPAGGVVLADGTEVEATPSGEGTAIVVPGGAVSLEVRGPAGTVWATRLDRERGDTLQAALSGEIVLEGSPTSPRGTAFLDGVPAGSAPGTLSGVLPGWHHVAVRDGDAVLFETGCSVGAGDVAMIAVPTPPAGGKAQLTVRARILGNGGFREAKGYPVRVDGAKAGVTPLDLTLKGGTHSVRVDAPDHPSYVEVIPLDAGTTRFVDAVFGGDERLELEVLPPKEGSRGEPLAVPVQVRIAGSAAPLAHGFLHLIRDGQAKPVDVPLVASGTDPGLWLAALPGGLTGTRYILGYVSGEDVTGRRGDSELFSVRLRPAS
jgi:PEGA domain